MTGEWLARPDWQVERKNRDAERDSELRRGRKLRVLRDALWRARRGWLAPDWRARGLNDAAAEAADRGRWGADEYFVWLEIDAMAHRIWEPAYREAAGYSWRAALESWRIDTLQVAREEESGERSVSAWAGFKVVDATTEQWDRLLDTHTGPWPDRVDAATMWRSMGVRAHVQMMLLDQLRVSYEGGLARGGVDIDWIGRHRERVSRWRMAGERDEHLALLSSPPYRPLDATDFASPLEYRLPSYWAQPESIAGGVTGG